MNCEKDFENILYEIQDGILYLTLNRPEAAQCAYPRNVEGHPLCRGDGTDG